MWCPQRKYFLPTTCITPCPCRQYFLLKTVISILIMQCPWRKYFLLIARCPWRKYFLLKTVRKRPYNKFPPNCAVCLEEIFPPNCDLLIISLLIMQYPWRKYFLLIVRCSWRKYFILKTIRKRPFKKFPPNCTVSLEEVFSMQTIALRNKTTYFYIF